MVKLRLAKLEADQQRGIPFNEAIGNDTLKLDIMARGLCRIGWAPCSTNMIKWPGSSSPPLKPPDQTQSRAAYR